MSFWDSLKSDFNNLVENKGNQVRVRHYTGSVSDTGWDDDQVWTPSGADVWTNGMSFPVKTTFGSQ